MNDIIDTIKKWLGFSKPLSSSKNLTQDDIYNAQKRKDEKELNRILEKINKKGMHSLSKKEKAFLKKHS